MASAVLLTAEHGYGRVGQKIKRCSKCRLNFIGDAVVEMLRGGECYGVFTFGSCC